MKGTIHKCLAEVICKKFGEDKWKETLLEAGFSPDYTFDFSEDIDEGKSLGLVVAVIKTTGASRETIFDLFGEYWVCEYAPRVYPFWFMEISSAKAFILRLDSIHDVVGKHFNNAKPPRFVYDEKDDSVLELEYQSKRDLLDLFISLVKGLGIYFKEKINIEKLSDSKLRLHFEGKVEQ